MLNSTTNLLAASAKAKFSLIGQDSEFFLWDTQADKLVPSYAYFPPKEEKIALGHQTSVYRDGLAVEVNTPPELCRAYVMDQVSEALQDGKKKVALPNHIKFTSRPYVEFTEELVKEFPIDLRVLGCSPTLDAYTEKQKVLKVNASKLLYRTSGSHLHMSYRPCTKAAGNKGFELAPELFAPWTKAADLFLGVPFAYIFNSSDEFKRRKLYGQAGEFRYQRYTLQDEEEHLAQHGHPLYYLDIARGLEYRVLSSRLWDHPMIASLFLLFFKYILSDAAFVWGELPKVWEKGWEDTIREAINLGTPKAQDEALTLFALHFPKSAKSMFTTNYAPMDVDATFQLFNTLRELSKDFVDASFVNDSHPESHYGFNDYAANDFEYNVDHTNFDVY